MIFLKYIFTTFIVPLSILIPITIFITKYRSASRELKTLFFYLIISGSINLAAIILVSLKKHNLYLLHFYTAVEAVFFLNYFREIFKQPLIKKILLVLMIVFPLMCAINYFYFQTAGFNTYTRPLEAIIIVFFCLLYFFFSTSSENLLDNPVSWTNAGILAYFPASVIIFVLSNIIIAGGNKKMNSIVWLVHAGLVLLMYLIWAYGFYIIKENGRKR